MLRICRKQDDYTFAERILNINSDFVLKSDFNIQYELVYFFEYKCNNELLERTLNRMRTQSATSSIPIARTLYNFYLRLNRFEKAKEISEHIRELEVSRHTSSQISRAEEQLESEQGVWIKLQELISEQEHNRQMIAMRDLLKGFSHELGQPITNIRYSTQLYQMKTQRGLATEEDILTLLQLILNQTERVGKMLKRFSPIVSSESKTDKFNVFNKINGVFLDLTSRLNICNIKYNLQGDREAEMCGDSIQFEQVFYNLILNSMQAISESMDRGCITVKISVNHQGNLLIFFIDNGPGIAAEHIKKVFEPFYSTKNPTSGNGGEGLGLFVVWNILKIFNGSILLDKEYKKGAKFIITINSKEVNLE